jgi:hypothetical protein
VKHLYRYKASWYGELLTGYTRSINERGAIKQAIYKIAKQVGKTSYAVREYLLDGKNKFEIERDNGKEGARHPG